MQEYSKTKSTLLSSIESLKDANSLSYDSLTSRIIPTTLLPNIPPADSSQIIEMRPPIFKRLAIPILVGLIVIAMAYSYLNNESENKNRIAYIIGMFVFIFLMFIVIRHFWFNPEYNNTLRMDKFGITHNSIFYGWNEILTSHIREVSYPTDDQDPQIFLLLGLTSGELKSLDISNVGFKKGALKPLNIDLVGHFIESYKINIR